MKKFKIIQRFVLIIILSMIVISCNNSKKSLKIGDSGRVIKQCLSAVNENAYDEMTRISVRNDELSLMEMVTKGEVFILEPGVNGVVRDVELGKYLFESDYLGETKRLWVASEFIE
jgi:maltodextrin utilization protein YvdJ